MNSAAKHAAQSTKSTFGKTHLLYGILRTPSVSPTTVLQCEALSDVEILEVADLRVAASTIPRSHMRHTADNKSIQRFNEVLSELHRLGDVLPFRFGTFVQETELASHLGTLREPVLHAFEQIAGCTEINIRWAFPLEDTPLTPKSATAALPRPTSGFEYLQSKRQARLQEQYMESIVEIAANELQRNHASECVAIRSSVRAMKTLSPNRDIATNYCIARVDLLVLRESCTTIMQTASSLHIKSTKPTLISGPWPPFSFISIDAKRASEDSERQPNPKRNCLEANA